MYCGEDRINKSRLEEIIDFMKLNKFKKIGLAFCIGLHKEASILTKILESNGFEVHAINCKNGYMPKCPKILNEIEQSYVSDIMCNPIGQAKMLNEVKTDFNLVLGLCIGCDSLFIKYSDALVTVFGVKDRVLAHNPLSVIYMSDGYYHDRLYGK